MKRSNSANKRIASFLNQTGTGKKRQRVGVSTSIARQLPTTNAASFTSGGQVGGFPSRSKVITLKFVREFTLNPALGGIPVEHVFRGNSLYDPDFTGAGGQPYGHDQWATIYASYIVLRSRIRVTAKPSVQPTLAAQWGIYISKDQAAAGSDLPSVLEKNTSTSSYNTFASNPPQIARASVDVAKMYAVKDLADDTTFQAGTGASPSAIPFYHVWASGIQASNPDSCDFLAEMEFDCFYLNPLTPAPS